MICWRKRIWFVSHPGSYYHLFNSWTHHRRILPNSPLLSFFPFWRVKEARERAVPARGSRWLELGKQQPLTKCLSALVVSSSGNGGCDVSAASPREEYPVQNGQLAKHRRLVRVTPSSPYHPALNWQENHNVVDLKATQFLQGQIYLSLDLFTKIKGGKSTNNKNNSSSQCLIILKLLPAAGKQLELLFLRPWLLVLTLQSYCKR